MIYYIQDINLENVGNAENKQMENEDNQKDEEEDDIMAQAEGPNNENIENIENNENAPLRRPARRVLVPQPQQLPPSVARRGNRHGINLSRHQMPDIPTAANLNLLGLFPPNLYLLFVSVSCESAIFSIL